MNKKMNKNKNTKTKNKKTKNCKKVLTNPIRFVIIILAAENSGRQNNNIYINEISRKPFY